MISTEKVFDMLPIVVDLYDKLDLDSYRKDIIEKNKDNKNVNKEMLGIDWFKYILKNSAKVKEEVFEIVSIFEDKPVEEVKAQSFGKTINTIKEIITDKETMSFFKQAV
ncbi:MAG TPA: hypothetical protein DEF42_17125 [Desulfosporosinus sp.]|nr:hypothetical protein [Desulfosporosinus sp.]